MDKLFSFDPGYNTGWALWLYETGECVDQGIVDFDHVFEFLLDMEGHLPTTRVIVVEDFRLLAHKAKAQIGSRFETIQVIGGVRQWAARYHVQIVLQSPTIKSIAQRWTGIKPVGSHDKSHSVDAFNHGAYYLKLQGKYLTKMEREMRDDA